MLLDLSAAFDTINHNILLNRLENFVGISAFEWFKSYLYADDTQLYISLRPHETYQFEKTVRTSNSEGIKWESDLKIRFGLIKID